MYNFYCDFSDEEHNVLYLQVINYRLSILPVQVVNKLQQSYQFH